MSSDPAPKQGWISSTLKDHFLLTPYNGIAFLCILELARWFCGLIGSEAYGTALGNLKLAGVMLGVAFICAPPFIAFGSALFGVHDADEQRDTFWAVGIWIPIGLIGFVTFLFRSGLIAIGAFTPQSDPPALLQWIFHPWFINWWLDIPE